MLCYYILIIILLNLLFFLTEIQGEHSDHWAVQLRGEGQQEAGGGQQVGRVRQPGGVSGKGMHCGWYNYNNKSNDDATSGAE